MLQALRIRDFRLLWAGSLVSSLGSWLLMVAVPAHILAATGSLRDTGLSLAAEYAPLLVLGPFAGVIADRCDRRRLKIAAALLSAAAVAAMLLGTSQRTYWVLYAALTAENSGTVLCAPAAQARVPAIVGTGPLLGSASALTSVSNGTARLVGGPLGAVLLGAFGMRTLICADSLSYCLAAGAWFLMSRPVPGRADGRGTVRAAAGDLVQGVRVLGAQPVARALLPVVTVFLAANAALSALLMPFAIQRLGGSEHAGFLLSCLGAGFLLGAPAVRVLFDRVQPRVLLAVTLTVTAGGYFLLFTASSLAGALPAAAAVGASGSMSLAVTQATLQRVVPGAALGRVSAIFLTGEAAATLAGAVAGPFLAQAAGLAATAGAASILTLAAAALAALRVPPVAADLAVARQHMLTPVGGSAYADDMEPVRDVAEDAGGSDPDTGLRAVAALRALTERLEILQVDNARRAGWSWQQIAARLGVTKQTVHRKHGKRTGRQP